MQENKISCALCGLPVEISGFSAKTTEGLQLFCCAGCLSVYRLLNGDKLLD
ncbi:MAG: heavy metal translocating P-type ATPase metal-binding domain-containing protein [Methyloprofundus sp.]|nr:heavy metal translocating P-type ATPase metal-binding domain-containing protein [Methyloprofundus sp.]MDT8426539.1 heavy metal translocating P-type ATPase metal-binding domain-containing protein [Methyloprofundus sp.]